MIEVACNNRVSSCFMMYHNGWYWHSGDLPPFSPESLTFGSAVSCRDAVFRRGEDSDDEVEVGVNGTATSGGYAPSQAGAPSEARVRAANSCFCRGAGGTLS